MSNADGQPIRSYTAGKCGTSGSLTELLYLFKGTRRASKNMRGEVEELIGEVREAERIATERYGMVFQDRDVLEIGVGQLPRQIAYFARKNRVTGIDLDVIPNGWNPGPYLRLLRSNGPKRLLKTVARKCLGVDRQFTHQLCQVLEVKKLPSSRLLLRDATATGFPAESFDFVYSFNVFEHLPDPVRVLEEVKRILRPGGVVLTHLHLYSCDSGCHDVRILSGERGTVPYWPHLRPRYSREVLNAAYINKLSLSQWEQTFESVMADSSFVHWYDKDLDDKRRILAELRQAGELVEYTDEELLTRNLLSFWQKPV